MGQFQNHDTSMVLFRDIDFLFLSEQYCLSKVTNFNKLLRQYSLSKKWSKGSRKKQRQMNYAEKKNPEIERGLKKIVRKSQFSRLVSSSSMTIDVVLLVQKIFNAKNK
ncbi:MAG: hypothetical protein EXX96DRAFT_534088 [Benjaminiella poitrasii]|nr:MAG: hypothetical protein EXX96DRAFT_534088 [Benjaminiella poitrasii]